MPWPFALVTRTTLLLGYYFYAADASLCSYCVINAHTKPVSSLATAVAALHRSFFSAIRQNLL